MAGNNNQQTDQAGGLVDLDESRRLEIFINGDIQSFSSPFKAKLMLRLLMKHCRDKSPWWGRYVMSYEFGIDYGVQWYSFKIAYPDSGGREDE